MSAVSCHWKFLDVDFNDCIAFRDSYLFSVCSVSRLFATVTAVLIVKLQWVYLDIVRSPIVRKIAFSRMFALGFKS